SDDSKASAAERLAGLPGFPGRLQTVDAAVQIHERRDVSRERRPVGEAAGGKVDPGKAIPENLVDRALRVLCGLQDSFAGQALQPARVGERARREERIRRLQESPERRHHQCECPWLCAGRNFPGARSVEMWNRCARASMALSYSTAIP